MNYYSVLYYEHEIELKTQACLYISDERHASYLAPLNKHLTDFGQEFLEQLHGLLLRLEAAQKNTVYPCLK